MNLIINSSFNKTTVAWELIHCCLIHPSESAIKAMCLHQTLTGLPRYFPKKTTATPCTVCYKEKMIIYPKGKKIDTTNLQPGEILYLDFAFYNITLICGCTNILTVVCNNTRIIWILPTASNLAPVGIIRSILTKL